ncbi:hypothetical protein ACPOLB_24785 [Rubrivivax sp. RP6-9]|uniref:hypothetical protein n=1 Tax=Rubrivivax sp. RP6-9 TaxID=3415750 RepID=UPI003CC684B2
MKLGPVQPIVPPPTAPLPVAAAAAVQAQGRAGSPAPNALQPRDDDPHNPAHGQGQRKGTQFKSPRNHQPRTTQPARPPRNAPGPRPAPNAPSAADAPPSSAGDSPDSIDTDDDFETRRRHAGQSAGSSSSQTDTGGGGEQGGRQDRKFAAIKRLRLGDLSAPLLGATDGIQAAMRAPHPAEALTAHLSGMARGASAPVESNAMAAYVLRAAQAWLASQGPGTSGGTATLGSVRATLVDSGGPTGAALTERHAAACVWLPVFLLNLDKPRTPQQRAQAIDRLAMLERRLALSRGTHQG